MASQPPNSSNSDQKATENDAELYAASAAENALPDGKATGTESTDLSSLRAALEEPNVVDQRQAPDNASQETSTGAPERELTKEEMVEEALNCPCIAAMRDGPCGDSFIAAYRCFLESETEPKGMDCMEQFTGMQSCMAEHPEEYSMDDDDDDPFSVGEGNQDKIQPEKDPSRAPETVGEPVETSL